MATYTAATFIPQLQPYQPDLNLYANLIQNKQTQYDSNWKSLNKIYGQYFYADLTREDNTKKKDYLLDQINFNVGRLAGLDLSLQQNVSQATQVFRPFYEDTGLMKDMAWTKNYNMQVGKAQALQGSADEKRRAQFWDDGLKALQYKREEFKDATADKALSFENVMYTPYVNVNDKAFDLAKKYGDIKTVQKSEDGKWMITKTNGEALEEPLNKLFEANLGSDPQIQALYQTQAYVNRKDYAYSNAAQFNGDKNAAEMKYLEDNFNILRKQSEKRYKGLQEANNIYDSKIKDLEQQIKNGTASPNAQVLLDNYREGRDINNSVLERAKKDFDTMSSGESKTATTSTGFKNPYGDIESLRYKVDNGVSSLLMQKDLDEAAHAFAYRNYGEEFKADPYAVMAEKQKYALQLADYNDQLTRARELDKEKREDDKQKIENGTHYKDENGNVVPREDLNHVVTINNDKGNVTDRVNLKNKSRDISNLTKQEYLDPFFKTSFQIIDKAIHDGKMSNKTAAYLLGYSKDKKISAQEFIDKYNKYGDSWLRKYVGEKGISSIHNRINTWVQKNRELSMFNENGQRTDLYRSFINGTTKVNDYMLYLKQDDKWRKDTSKAVEKSLMKDGFQYAYLLYDDKGNLRSEKEFNQMLIKNKKLSPEDLKAYNDYKQYKKELKISLANNRKFNNMLIKKGLSFDSALDYIMAVPKLQLAAFGATRNLVQDIRSSLPSWLQSQDAIDPRDPRINSRVAKVLNDFNYSEMVNKSGQKYSDHNVVKGKLARLAMGPVESGTGTFTIGSSQVTVNPKGMTLGKAHFAEIMPVLRSLDFGGNDVFTLGGNSKTAYDNAKGMGIRKTQGQKLINSLIADFNKAQIKGSKSKLSEFDLQVSPIAGGSSNLASVTIIPNKEWLDQYLSSNTEKQNNLLSAEDYRKAITNGLTFITNASNLNGTTMYRQSFLSPLASYVESLPKGEKYELSNIGGDPYKSYSIEKNYLGTGDYISTVTFPEYNPNTGEIVKQEYRSNNVMQGGLLESNRDQILNWFNQVDDNNNYLFNNYYKSN